MFWNKNLTLNLSESVLDVVQFGSSTIETKVPNDIDICVVFKEISLKQQLEEAQEIKKQLENHTTLPIHIKSFTLETFLEKENFAREGILAYGLSLLSAKPFSLRFGLIASLQISYSLKKLDKTQKVRIHYQLRGRKGEYGLLKKLGGALIKPGLICVPPQTKEIILSFFEKENIEISGKIIYESI